MDKITTIAIKESNKKRLDKLKIHPNQSYDEIIEKMTKEGVANDSKSA